MNLSALERDWRDLRHLDEDCQCEDDDLDISFSNEGGTVILHEVHRGKQCPMRVEV